MVLRRHERIGQDLDEALPDQSIGKNPSHSLSVGQASPTARLR